MNIKAISKSANETGGLLRGFCPPVSRDEPFDKDVLIWRLRKLIKTHVVVSDHQALLIALWIIFTWAYKSFERCPLLLINAPERECGKTQLLKLVGLLVHRALETANITLAALFRIVSKHEPTLLIDEADTFLDGRGEMAGIINKGYERGGVVLRVETVGKELVEKFYHVHGPKVLAGIALERHLQPATMSRGIQIAMKRKTRDQKVERLRSVDSSWIADLRSGIYRFVQDHETQFAEICVELPDQLGDREQDNAEPLLVIAKCLGDDWYRQAREAIITLSEETAPPKSPSNQLLEDIREALSTYSQPYIPTAKLLELLHDHPDMDWCRYNYGQPLTSRQLARFLGQYGIKPKTVRMKDGSTPKGYEVRHFDEAFKRYLPELLPEVTPEDIDPGCVSAQRPTEPEAFRPRSVPGLLRTPGQGFPPSPSF